MKRLWTLFWEMFKIALFVVGGGFAILTVADEVFSKKFRWTEEGEVMGHLPVFQMVPGIIAGNTAIYIGRKVAGLPGALAALLGVFLPSVIVFSAVSAGYSLIPLGNPYLTAVFIGLRAALTGIIAAMVVRSWRGGVARALDWFVLAVSLAAIGPLDVNPAFVVMAAAVFGVAAGLLEHRGGTRTFASSFWSIPLIFLKYGSIAFGGGYVLVPVYIADFVGESAPYLQLSGHEFADVMALTQMTPGPVAVNCATFFGFRMGVADFASPLAGVAYAFAATVFLLLPGAILLYIALGSLERFKSSRAVQGLLSGVRPVTIAMMLNALWAFAGMSLWTCPGAGGVSFHPVAVILAAFAGWATFTKRVGVVKTILACAALAACARFCAPFLI